MSTVLRFRIVARFVIAAVVSMVCCRTPVVAQQTADVRVVQTIWGLDGRVVRREFQPLSILLDNLTGDSVEGRLVLRQYQGLVRETGVVLEQDLFLGPRSRRWVQFYPWVGGNSDSWELLLEVAGETTELASVSQPVLVSDPTSMEDEKRIRRVAVILDSAGSLERSPTAVKHLAEEVFPPWSTALHGLHALYLDRVPQWDVPQQQAMLTWLKMGGQLFLLRDNNGSELQFRGDLSELNGPQEQFSVGHGTVNRLGVQRQGLTDQMVQDVVQLERTDLTNVDEDGDFNQIAGRIAVDLWDDVNIWEGLLREVRPQHNVGLITLLALMYIGLLYPGCWWLSQSPAGRFPRTHLAVLGLVLSFGGMFQLLGQRGYGENSSLRGAVIARHTEGSNWECLQFGRIFVTDGGKYTVNDSQRQTLFSGSPLGGSVQATARSGQAARYSCSIPPFSSSLFVSRFHEQYPEWDLSVSRVVFADGRLTQLALTVGSQFPAAEMKAAYVVSNSRVYPVFANAETGMISLQGRSFTLKSWLSEQSADGEMLSLIPAAPAVVGGAGVSGGQSVRAKSDEERLGALLALRAFATAGTFQDNDLSAGSGGLTLLVITGTEAERAERVTPDLAFSGLTVFVRPLPRGAGL